MSRRPVVFVAVLAVAAILLADRFRTVAPPGVPAWEPAEGFIPEIPDAVRLRHEHHLALIRKGPLDLIFFGDSIARGWEDHDDLWETHFAPRRCGLFATTNDTTSNLLWRIDHGELDRVTPKAVVVLIGTNNRKDPSQTADDIAKGIETVVNRIKAKQPQAKILLLGILPQGRRPSDAGRVTFDRVNVLLSRFSDGRTVYYRDHGPSLLDTNGRLNADVSPDGTHLTRLGYERWAAMLAADLRKVMGE